MADVSINVVFDGKTVFAHGATASPDACACVLAGLDAATNHFKSLQAAVQAAAAPKLTQAQAQAEMAKAAAANQKGPSL